MITTDSLGSADFKRDHGVRHAYVAGSMVRAIASVEMVVAMGKAGLQGYFGTGALGLEDIERGIQEIGAALDDGEAWGVNLLANVSMPEAEMATVSLFLRQDIRRIEVSAFMQITPALVKFRAKGVRRDSNGGVVVERMILAKLSRPEIAELFLGPAPERIVNAVAEAGEITRDEADMLRPVPMSDDICVEADSSGHTDMGVMSTLLPTIRRIRDEAIMRHGFECEVRIGAAGGIGTPEAAASAVVLGADFILTGSVNQCTVEAGTSDAAKDLLVGMNVQDTAYCPSGSLFELDAKTQVLKKGVFFPARANKLHEL